MARPADVIRYLRDCYRADNREHAVLDLFAAKVDYRRFVERAGDLLCGLLDRLPIIDPELLEVGKTAALHRTEKALELGVFFVVGRVLEGTEEGRYRRLCAPLVSYPATIHEEPGAGPEAAALEIELERPRINTPLLGLLAAAVADERDARDALVEHLAEVLSEPAWNRERAGRLAEALSELPGLESGELAEFPDLVSAAVVERRRRSRSRPRGALDALCLPAAAVMLTRRPIDTRGVLSELERLAETAASPAASRREKPVGELSPPLSIVLGRPPESLEPPTADRGLGWLERLGLVAPRPRSKLTGRVPAVLSTAQKKILEVASEEPLSLVIGPPGTGKSFTIACLALDALGRGESVLVASKMNHAVDVVADKIEDLVGGSGLVVRGGRRQYRRELVARLENIVSGILPFEPRSADDMRKLLRRLRDCDEEIVRLERILDRRTEAEKRWGEQAVRARRSSRGFERLMARLRSLVAPTQNPPHWRLMEEYQHALERRIEMAKQRLRAVLRRRIEKALAEDRSSLTRLLSSLRSRTVARRRIRFEKARRETLFSAFPVWLTNLSDMASVVPLTGELFDLLIVDEATQCDLASCLPALQRARRAVIVGDPKQLRHLSFVSRRQQAGIARRQRLDDETAGRLDYRQKSLLDAVSELLPSQDVVTFLDEHFRSAPQIIAFSNSQIYDSSLRVMRERPAEVRARDGGAPLRWRKVAGKRDDSGANRREAEALLEDLSALVLAEQRRPALMRHSVGVVSPFRAQVDLLTRWVAERLDAGAIERHALRIGTPYAFQGEERDAIFLSLALDPDSHPTAFRFAQRPDVFNVAITRARSLQWVYSSLTSDQVPQTGLLTRFLAYLEEGTVLGEGDPTIAGRRPADDPFSHQVTTALEERGCRVWPRWSVAGFEVDLVVEREDRCVGVDLLGYPGDLAGAFRLERYRIFARAGLSIVPLPYSAWTKRREDCLAAVEDRLAARSAGRDLVEHTP